MDLISPSTNQTNSDYGRRLCRTAGVLLLSVVALLSCKQAKEIGEAALKGADQAAKQAGDPVQLTPEGREVTLVEGDLDPAVAVSKYSECDYEAHLEESSMLKIKDIGDHFRNEAAEMGGNAVAVTDIQDGTAEGKVYDCR